jgi:Flp pilus assembly protein TadG
MSWMHARNRAPAQVIVLFALGLLGFLAMVGVVIDGGTLYLQRRTAQNAADAAALAGTRALQQATQQSTATVGDAICTYLLANAFGVTPTATAYFVDTGGVTNLGAVSLSSGCLANAPSWIPNATSGVHVDVTVGPYNTYLVGMVGLRTMMATAAATAQIGVLGIPRPDLTPLAGCGRDMLVDGQSPTPFRDILMPAPSGSINPALFSPPALLPVDVVLQGSQMTQNEVAPQGANCPAWNGSSSAWKGKVDISGVPANATLTPPFQLPVDTGNGSIDGWVVNTCVTLFGASGDPTNKTASTSTCYLLVPIAAPPNPPNLANIVTLACFKVYDGNNGPQKWRGVLVDITTNTCTYGVYPPTWTFGNTFSETQVMLR